MISDAISQTSLFHWWKEIGDVCTRASAGSADQEFFVPLFAVGVYFFYFFFLLTM